MGKYSDADAHMDARGRAASHRMLRIGENIRHALSEVLARGDLAEPALKGVSITVTEVKCSPDMRNATVFVMPLGGVHLGDTLDGLNRCRKYLRGQLGRLVRMKYVPTLNFKADASFGEADRIEELLRSPHVAQDLGVPEDDENDPVDEA